MAAPLPHHELLNLQHTQREWVKRAPALTNAPDVLARQALLTPAQIHAQQQHNNAQLLAGFLPPHFSYAGTLPQLNNVLATIVNGFGLKCERHLMRVDGTVDDPVYPPECSCGTWDFLAWGCGHPFCSHENICGRAMLAHGRTRHCRGTKGVRHMARARVLGPCISRGCTWWAERLDAIDALGVWSSLLANGDLRRVWAKNPPLPAP